ncbi:MAG: L,D-transpeptidase family protein [Nocardioidaceae bacterium]
MKKYWATTCAAAIVLSLGTATAGGSAAAASQPSGVVQASAGPARGFHLTDKFAREFTRYGDVDSSTYSIDHVRELQYRLRWVHTFHTSPSGSFGPITRRAVKSYQRKEGLQVTGVAGHLTWQHLIHDTIRRRGAVPHTCKTTGWHACYDRSAHQVTLWHSGRLHNSWLVRGGEYGTPTRVGNTQVYSRDIDHVSHLPGAAGSPMPYAQFFDGGQAYHGSAYMIDPFSGHSHGCINMYIEDARQLWKLTSDKRLYVSVYGAWD